MEEVIVKLTNLTKKYDSHVVVDGLNLEIKKGEIFGTVLDKEKTKLIKDKLDKKNATQKLVSCSISGIVMNKDSKKPFNKQVHMRKGNY